MTIGKDCRISWRARLDKSINPKGIHIGDRTWILSDSTILAHDHCRSMIIDTYIGNDCVIGINSIVLPGVRIGDNCVVGAGSVISKNMPSNSLAVGNPAKIIKNDIKVKNGKIMNNSNEE